MKLVENPDWQVEGEFVMRKNQNPLNNPFYGYRTIDLILPGGKQAQYHGILVGPCVHAVTLTDDRETVLVKQHRPNVMPVGGSVVPTTWELPGGFAHNPKDLEASIRSEVGEETGGRGRITARLGSLYPSTGVSDEVDTIFLVEDFIPDPSLSRSDEPTEADIDLWVAPFEQVYDSMHSGEFTVSAQTLAALSLADYHLRNR